jgi:predicted ATPase
MLTRLKVKGFKNLVNVDVCFGPFTCIAGPNASGKSNLFDAIHFLSALANRTLMEAALSVRSEKVTNADVRSLFHKIGEDSSNHMSFEAEMISPTEAVDDLGQTGKATANFLRYCLDLRYRENHEQFSSSSGPLEILREELTHIHQKEASKHLLFPHSPSKWRKTAVKVARRAAPFISTDIAGPSRIIKLHQDGGGRRGRAISNPANQPRTVLSVANASESPTVLCARREMESWQMLQLEPSSLREPDSIRAPSRLESNGLHLPKTLYHLARHSFWDAGQEKFEVVSEKKFYARIASRLTELVNDVDKLWVDYDDKRELLTLMVAAKNGTPHPARSLSDGTLRFLALAVLEQDPRTRGLVCLEEPENGIHPERIPSMLNLLQDIAVDVQEGIDESNPLRQVVVNTHSPAFVLEVPDDTLLVVEPLEEIEGDKRFSAATFSCLSNTWRSKTGEKTRTVPKGQLLSYLNPLAPCDEYLVPFYARIGKRTSTRNIQDRPRVADRTDLQAYLPRLVAEDEKDYVNAPVGRPDR